MLLVNMNQNPHSRLLQLMKIRKTIHVPVVIMIVSFVHVIVKKVEGSK